MGWWVLTLGVGLLFAVVLSSVVNAFVLGLFIYYTMRPLYRRLHRVIRSPSIAAAVTMFGVAVPILVLIVYVGLRAVREILRAQLDWVAIAEILFGPALASTVRNTVVALQQQGSVQFEPSTTIQAIARGTTFVGPIGNALVTVFLAVALAFFLLRDGDRLVAWFRTVLDVSEGSTLSTYALTVDHDLESIYLGQVATAVLVGIASVVVYNGFNAVVPAAITIPLPTMLGILTGIASLIPIVVGKLVYVPLVLYLLNVATRSNASILPVVGLFVVAFVFLDVVPQLFVRPYLAGRQLHVGLVMFSYVVGTLVFGWSGLFLGPLLLVVGLHLLGIVVPELLHGEPVTSADVAADPFAVEPESDQHDDGSSGDVPD